MVLGRGGPWARPQKGFGGGGLGGCVAGAARGPRGSWRGVLASKTCRVVVLWWCPRFLGDPSDPSSSPSPRGRQRPVKASTASANTAGGQTVPGQFDLFRPDLFRPVKVLTCSLTCLGQCRFRPTRRRRVGPNCDAVGPNCDAPKGGGLSGWGPKQT